MFWSKQTLYHANIYHINMNDSYSHPHVSKCLHSKSQSPVVTWTCHECVTSDILLTLQSIQTNTDTHSLPKTHTCVLCFKYTCTHSYSPKPLQQPDMQRRNHAHQHNLDNGQMDPQITSLSCLPHAGRMKYSKLGQCTVIICELSLYPYIDCEFKWCKMVNSNANVLIITN